MSMECTYYVIYGWDITSLVDGEKLEDYRWNHGGDEKYFCNQCSGHVQIWDGGASADHTYLGFCVWCAEEYNYDCDGFFDLKEFNDSCSIYDDIFGELVKYGVIEKSKNIGRPRIICFAEWS